MRKDAKFRRFARHFSHQWLGLPSLENVAINPKLHPDFTDATREALKEETSPLPSTFSPTTSAR